MHKHAAVTVLAIALNIMMLAPFLKRERTRR
jgi:hypothetical protein